MDVYGLTGGIGSGKSTVTDLLEEYGVPVVSADELSRIVVAKGSAGLADVVQRFGTEVLDTAGELDRRKMASIVFQDTSQRRELEAILHPRIRERFEQVLDALEKAGHNVAVYEVPLLFEKNLHSDMKAVILVTAPEAVRVARVRQRDDVTQTEVRARISAQMPESLKRKRADYVIENDGSVDDLRREVEFLLARFLRLEPAIRQSATPPDIADSGHTRVVMGAPTPDPYGGRPAAKTMMTPAVAVSQRRTEVPSATPTPSSGTPLSPNRPPSAPPGHASDTPSRASTVPTPPVRPNVGGPPPGLSGVPSPSSGVPAPGAPSPVATEGSRPLRATVVAPRTPGPAVPPPSDKPLGKTPVPKIPLPGARRSAVGGHAPPPGGSVPAPPHSDPAARARPRAKTMIAPTVDAVPQRTEVARAVPVTAPSPAVTPVSVAPSRASTEPSEKAAAATDARHSPAAQLARAGGTVRVPAVGSPEFAKRLEIELEAVNTEADKPDDISKTQVAPAVVPPPPKKG